MKTTLNNVSGFTLIELIVAIVVIGIIAGVAMQSMTSAVKDARTIETEREMEMLAAAIVGDPDLRNAGARADFGYIGDVGAFPPNLQALSQNPAGYATWAGPYIKPGFSEDTDGFSKDAWGKAYSYAGGIMITSTGGGSTLTKKIADAGSDYLNNHFNGTIRDANDSGPGTIFTDSVDIKVSIPNGTGGMITKTYAPDSAGSFTLDSLPVGTHSLRLIFTPEADTLQRYITILPRHKSGRDYRFASAHFTVAAPPPTSAADTLRPNGNGAITNLANSGCGSNYQCVDEVVSDGGTTQVSQGSGTYATDVYSLEDPSIATGTIGGVTVYCRARRTSGNGAIRPTLYVGLTEYNGATQELTVSWEDYSQEWTTNPATGAAWTWPDIISLQAGQSLDGHNNSNPAYCTQVWVVVAYTY